METRSHLRSQNECINDFVNKVEDQKSVVVLQRDFQQMSANVRIPVRPYVILQDGNSQEVSHCRGPLKSFHDTVWILKKVSQYRGTRGHLI
jgi:hypothetical protein